MPTQRIKVRICHLECGDEGAGAMERMLARQPGVQGVFVDLLWETAYIEFDPTVTGLSALVAVVEQHGYRVGSLHMSRARTAAI
jgi:copper chaperone CopZ